MFYAGNRNTEILRKYIQDIPCSHCEENTEHLLIIYCKTFVFGIFYPFKWWASDKKGYMKCRKCGKETAITENNPEIPAKVLNYFTETKIPFRYKLPSYLILGTLISISVAMFFGLFSVIFSVFTPLNTKLQGKWQDEYSVYQLYIYKDKTYTAVGYDTIAFGKYRYEKGMLDFPFIGGENEIPKINAIPLVLHDSADDAFRFEKIRKLKEFDDVYRAENNKWRTKPSKPQTNAEIRNKVLQYLEFEQFKYEKAVEEKVDFVEADPNSAIVFAVNGMQVNGNSEQKFRNLFYNDEDWIKATEILHHEFPKDFKLNPDEKNLFKRNVDFLKLYIKKVKESDLSFLK